MKNFLLEKNLLLLGDKSRYIFAKELTGVLPPNYENFSVILERGEKISDFQKKDDLMRLSSFKTPPGIKISLLKTEDFSWTEDFENFSQVIIFEEFPFKKDSTQQLTETWSSLPKNRPPLLIVLMDLQHRQGSTDLDRIDDALADAEKNYKSQDFDVNLFHSADDVINILYRRENLITRHKKILAGELEKIYDRMYELDYLYDDFVMDCEDKGGCLSLSAINTICSFESVKRSFRDSIWDSYNEAALKKILPAATSESQNSNILSSAFNAVKSFFTSQTDDKKTVSKGTLNDLIKIYTEILTGSESDSETPNKHLEQGKVELINILRQSFYKFMASSRFSGKVYSYEIKDASSYRKLTSDTGGRFYGINAEYSKKLRQFVAQESKTILKSALESYINFFERVIR